MAFNNSDKESSLYAYHETFAIMLATIFTAKANKQQYDNAKDLMISNIVYARTLCEEIGGEGDEKLTYIDELKGEKDLNKLLAKMTYWQKKAKLTPEIVRTFGTSYFLKSKFKGKSGDVE